MRTVLKDIDINELTLDNIGSWPMPVKIIAIAFVCIALVVLVYFVDTKGQFENLNSMQQQEKQLRMKFEIRQNQAANINVYRKQLAVMKKSFGKMLRQLPSRTEVPGLLEDISKSGVASGLEFKLFDPLEEVQYEFYAELPIRITVIGNYHQLADFISRVAGLDRIVTLHDFKILHYVDAKQKQRGKKAAPNPELLEMDITAKTFRYSEGPAKGSRK